MAERAFLEGHSGQTVDELIALEATHRIDSLVVAFEQALSRKSDLLGSEALSWPERVVLAVEAMEREVNSDGWFGFFSTSSNEFAPLLESALNAIECPGFARLAARALAALKVRGTVDAGSLIAALEKGGDRLSDVLNALDREYYASLSENIEQRLFEFIKANREQIRFL